MMKRLEVVIEWGTHKEFRFGYAYTKDEILSRQYISPRGFEEIWKAITHNAKVDYFRYIAPNLQRVNSVVAYKLEKYEEMIIGTKKLVKASFVAVVLTTTAGLVYFSNPIESPKVVKASIEAPTTKKVDKKKGKPSKKAVKKAPVLSLKDVKNQLAFYESKILFNPNVRSLYAGKKAEQLSEPTSKLPFLQKFNSYEDGVMYFYWLCKHHNMTHDKKVNVRGYMAQVGIEMGLRPIKRGYVSRLGTFANNPHGGKTFDKTDIYILKSKDDEYRKGKKIHSNFRIFASYADALENYAELINQPRYRGLEEVEYNREALVKGVYVKRTTILKNDISPYMASSQWFKYVQGLRISGYCTAPEGQYERQCRVTYIEQSKVLKQNGISE